MRSQILVIVLATASLLLPAYALAQPASGNSASKTTAQAASTPADAAAKPGAPAKKPATGKTDSKAVLGQSRKVAVGAEAGTGKTSVTVSKVAPKKGSAGPMRKTRSGERVPVNMRSPAVSGPIGLDRIWSADTGPQGTFRMRLSLSWFDAADFPIQGTNNTFLGTDIALAYTPHHLVETFLAFRGTSNTNEGGRPELINTQGDMTLGAKVGTSLAPTYSTAGALGIRLLSGVGGAGFDGAATSVDLRWLNTLDFKKTGEAPVRAHFDVGYYFENSESVYASENGEPGIIEEFGLQIARYDRLTVGIGLEFPIQEDVDPYLEYSLTLPILVELARRGEGSGDYGFGSVPHSLTAGFRSYPLPELAFDLAIRYGLSDQPYTGVPSTPPWTVVLGAAYTLDPRPQVIERVVKADALEPPKAAPVSVAGIEVTGRVMALGGQKPLVGAKVSYPGKKGSSAQVTDLQGRFSGYRFEAGKVVVQAEADGYLKAKTTVDVKGDKPVVANFELKPDPAAQDGQLEVRVFDDRGRPVKARVALGGNASGTSGDATPKAPFKATVKAGRYPMTVSAKGFQDVKRTIQVKGADTASLRVTLSRPLGAKAAPISSTPARRTGSGGPISRGKYATVTSRGIKLNKKVSFKKGTSQLTADGKLVLDDVARGLNRIKTIKKVRIGAHASTPASRAANMKLSNDRARAVKTYLVGKGVAASRLQPRGFGATKPIGPNITARGRAKNNRINFLVLGR